MLKNKQLLLLLFFTIIISKSYAQTPFDTGALIEDIPNLIISETNNRSEEVTKYLGFYNLNYSNQKHAFGRFMSEGYNISAHVIIPENPKGTIFIIHGYFDHTGHMKPLIDLFLSLNYAVATVDLPGHGLSSGTRGEIGSFNDYALVINTFLEKFRKSLPEPLHLAGHSTGCSAIYEYLNDKPLNTIKSVILIAPLIRSNHWELSKTAFWTVKYLFNKVPRRFTKSSGSEEFLDFLKNDPLEGRFVSTRWFNALYNWNIKISQYKVIKTPVLIVQGNKDTTVDWQYNLDFIKEKMPENEVHVISGGRHHLPNEETDIQRRTFRHIERFLTEIDPKG